MQTVSPTSKETPIVIRAHHLARHVSIRIKQGQIHVTRPLRATQRDVDAALTQHADWISTQLAKEAEKITLMVKIAPGELINFCGREMEFVPTERARVVVDLGGGQIELPAGSSREQQLTALRNFARKYLRARVRELAHIHNFRFNEIRIKDTSTRWGSCSHEGNINLNWRLCFAPGPVIDYVIIHELAHTIQLNHSDKFWQLVRSAMPEYSKWRTWLRRYGDTLSVL